MQIQELSSVQIQVSLNTCIYIYTHCCFNLMVKIFSVLDGKFGSECFQETKESNKFRQEYEMRKIRQARFVITLINVFIYVRSRYFILNKNKKKKKMLIWLHPGWRFGYCSRRIGYVKSNGPWHEWGYNSISLINTRPNFIALYLFNLWSRR